MNTADDEHLVADGEGGRGWRHWLAQYGLVRDERCLGGRGRFVARPTHRGVDQRRSVCNGSGGGGGFPERRVGEIGSCRWRFHLEAMKFGQVGGGGGAAGGARAPSLEGASTERHVGAYGVGGGVVGREVGRGCISMRG